MKNRQDVLRKITDMAFILVHYCEILRKMHDEFPSIAWQNSAFDLVSEYYHNG